MTTETTSQMAELTGSEKQITWAEDIRTHAMPSFIRWAEGSALDAEMGLTDPFIAYRASVAVEALSRQTSASFWIDCRNFLPYEGQQRGLNSNDETASVFCRTIYGWECGRAAGPTGFPRNYIRPATPPMSKDEFNATLNEQS